jgi:CheY-like chemotaxis protein
MSPKVLIVDDAPGRQNTAAKSLRARGLDVEVLGPGGVMGEHLSTADLVLVDFDLSAWSDREESEPISLQPLDGLALAAVLRSHLGYGKQTNPTAFALHTGHMGELSADAPQYFSVQGLSRIHNLEWIFQKGRRDRLAAIASLARAVDAMPDRWPSEVDEATAALEELLAIDTSSEMADEAKRDLEAAHPPTHELSNLSQGMTALRWMLQRILPYPCFLLDDWHLAARLGVSCDSLQKALEKGSLASSLARAEYGGFLCDFAGRRWWRAGIEVWVDEVSDRGSWSRRKLGAALAKKYPTLKSLEMEAPVVAVDGSDATVGLVDAGLAVRVQFDDWPSFAESAWARIDDVLADDALRARVVRDDRTRLAVVEAA